MAAVWLRNLEEAGTFERGVEWKTFSLEQINLDPEADRDALWAEPESRRGILPAAATKWAQAQGEDVARAVRTRFFEARHVERRRIGQPEVTAEVLDEAGLDGSAVVKELLEDPKWRRAARDDHEEAEGQGIFGVPTLVFPGLKPVFVRLTEITEGDRAREVYERIRDTAADPLIHEFKRPRG